MASNFSVWLREAARLYLRYMAVGLLGVPLAALYAWARRADWNMTAVTVALCVLGFVTAVFLWRRLGNWQMSSAEVTAETTDATSDAWTDLVNSAIRTTVTHQQIALCLQQSVSTNEEQLRTWNLLLKPVDSRAEEHHTRLLHSLQVAEAADVLKNFLAQQSIETEQESGKQLSKTEPRRQRQPAWAFALRGQTQNAHGLA